MLSVYLRQLELSTSATLELIGAIRDGVNSSESMQVNDGDTIFDGNNRSHAIELNHSDE